MKTILVLTDFSINSSYAAQYALELAQQIEANLLLCNIYQRPTDEQAKDTKQWNMSTAEKNSVNDLGALLSELKNTLDKEVNKNKYRPGIEQCSMPGQIADRVNEIAAGRQIVMAVISMHSAGFLATILAGNHASDIIDKAKFPVLVIPYQVRYNPYKTIAFASAMNYSDIGVLQSLSGLAAYSGANILVAHVDAAKAENKGSVKHFFNHVCSEIIYPKIEYRNILNQRVMNSLNSLMTTAGVDLLVLVHRKPNFFRMLFKQSVAQKLASNVSKPLLVFPCSTVLTALPVF